MSKVIIVSAPSGSGKSTIIHHLLKQNLGIEFSISATSRAIRGQEKDGVDYYFLTADKFREKIANNEFLEYEEVYKDKFYGTLKSEVERIATNGGTVILDVDVVGGCNVKKYYGDKALSIFIQPPSVAELRKRLENRGTDDVDVIEARIAKAEQEMAYADKFDAVVINDNLVVAQATALQLVKDFISK